MKNLMSTTANGRGQDNSSSEGNSSCPEAGSESLIICDFQLASSFRDVKLGQSRLKPGHYLHKVFISKLRSQSVPSLDTDRSTANGSLTPVKVEEASEDWFKTWPDCVDKEKLRNDMKEEVPSDGEFLPNTPKALKDVHLPLAYNPVTKKLHLLNDTRRTESVPEIQPFHESAPSSFSHVSPSNADDNDQSSSGNCSIVSEDQWSDKSKIKSFTGLFTRVKGVKVRDQESWNLFSRSSTSGSEGQKSPVSDQGVVGSSGLILLERPAWLPPKSHEEHMAHVDQHNKILSSNRKKNIKETKSRDKLLQQQLKAEDETARATRIWTQEVFLKWPSTRSQKRTQELWWQGIPPSIRGKIWKLAIPNDLNVTHDLFHICLSRATERLRSEAAKSHSLDEPAPEAENDRVHSMDLIQLDICRTFPHLSIFQQVGPYYEMLHSVLAAYVCYRPDVGYVQGMSFIAAVLILNMDAPDAFVCFANLLNRQLLRAFFALDQPVMNAYYATYNCLLEENLPQLHKHLQECQLTPDLYLLDWLYTIFAKATHLDVASRLWDVFLRDGEEFLLKAAIGVLKMFESELLTMDFLGGSKFLTRLPDQLSPTKLFKCIAQVKMNVGKTTFHGILRSHLNV